METFEITCPGCKTILIVDRRTGKIVEKRKPIVEDSTGDRFEDARLRVKGAGSRIEEKVEAAKKAEKEKLAKLEALFKDRQKEIEEKGEPIEKPDDIFND